MVIDRKNNIKRSLIIATIGIILICISQLVITDDLVNFIVSKVLEFGPSSIPFGIWEYPPYDLLIKIYAFNVTNPEEFLSGTEKLRFQEIGPYVYQERLLNLNPVFNDNGTLSYEPRRILEFKPELSVGDAKEDVFVSPNIPLLGITAKATEYSAFTQLGLASITSLLGSEEFRNLTVDEYLFGYDDPLITAANTFISNWIDFSKFGILDRIMALDNGSDIVTMNIKNEDEKYRRYEITRWNGSPGIGVWGYESERNCRLSDNTTCGKVEGAYAGTIFPPNIKTEDTFLLYRHAFCRTIPLYHHSNVTTKDGFEAFLYKTTKNFLSRTEENPDNACYCNTEFCHPNGLGDISPCYYGIPISISEPHFLNADPVVTQNIDGVKPDADKHELLLTIHPRLGVILEAKLRLQMNLIMPETNYNVKTERFNNLAIPMLWAELAVDTVPDSIYFYTKLVEHVLPIVQCVSVYLLSVIGGCMLFGSAIAILISPSNNTKSPLTINYSQVPILRKISTNIPAQIVIKK